ncbi:MAG: aspartate ammonia-lyase [Betaproteobacteria bacterium]|nr:aspartate ammonia-lyase [Betaproteobacteria bacterium]
MRTEHDFLGEREIPDHAYWGVHTLRAVENYPITGLKLSAYGDLIKALAMVKRAAAKANLELGALDQRKAGAIVRACDELIHGKLHGEFVVDVIQGGAGTSTNMNANEVIANRGLEILGHAKGQYEYLHPNDDVNASQSTNDVYPTAVRLALCFAIDRLLASMASLRHAFEQKSDEFKSILKIGRTQLQDAVPMTLGQEFSTFSVMIGEDESRLAEARALITEINLGATAIGTGINTDARYADLAIRYLREESGYPLVKAANLIEATQDCGAFVQLSGVLKRIAVKLSKTCNDLRLLSSGPQAGFNEIRLPARAAGSSIMPGKVNPVIPEVMNQVAFEVIGNDITVTMAAEAGQLQLNAFEPVIGWSLFKSINHLANACMTLRENCVLGITANVDLLADRVRHSVTVVTALVPIIGYERSALLGKHALATGRSIAELAEELGIMKADDVEKLLKPELLTQPMNPGR